MIVTSPKAYGNSVTHTSRYSRVTRCDAGYYNVAPEQHSCLACPENAVCTLASQQVSTVGVLHVGVLPACILPVGIASLAPGTRSAPS